jgi:hypothetical protein
MGIGISGILSGSDAFLWWHLIFAENRTFRAKKNVLKLKA